MSEFIQFSKNLVARVDAITQITKFNNHPAGDYYRVRMSDGENICVGIESDCIKWLDMLFDSGIATLRNFYKATDAIEAIDPAKTDA